MIFVDTNVFMYAVGRPHPLRAAALEFFSQAERNGESLCTSAEVVQELAHAYLRVRRLQEFDATTSLMSQRRVELWPLEAEDVMLARQLYERHPTLGARDLCHLASCRRRGIDKIKTYDRALLAAYRSATERT